MRSPIGWSRMAAFLALSLLLACSARAETPQQMWRQYEDAARKDNAAFKANPARGETFYRRQPPASANSAASACAGCHSADPRQAGRTRANKQIEALAPVANPGRFSDRAKVEKWFARNCGDALGRDCSASEKADFVAWLANLN